MRGAESFEWEQMPSHLRGIRKEKKEREQVLSQNRMKQLCHVLSCGTSSIKRFASLRTCTPIRSGLAKERTEQRKKIFWSCSWIPLCLIRPVPAASYNLVPQNHNDFSSLSICGEGAQEKAPIEFHIANAPGGQGAPWLISYCGKQCQEGRRKRTFIGLNKAKPLEWRPGPGKKSKL